MDVPLDIEAGAGGIEFGLFADEATRPFNEWFPVTEVNIEQTDRIFEAPDMQVAADADFAGLLSLLGANLSAAELEPGDTLDLSLFWQGTQRMDTSYSRCLSTFWMRTAGMLAQEDRIPAAGARPTTGWIPGEVIEDTYRLSVGPRRQAR